MDDVKPNRSPRQRVRPAKLARAGLLGIAVIVLLAVVAGAVWVATPYRANDTALAALASSDSVEVVDTGDAIVFRPSVSEPAGLLFYPGGRVEVESYAPLARRIADRGFFVALLRMPLGLAVLDADAAAGVIGEERSIERWVVGGHSLGGAMAAQFAGRSPDVSGLVLLAAYPPESTDLSGTDVQVLSMRGTQDGLVGASDIDATRKLLPATTRYVLVPDGNHAGFGSYGPQRGDGEAALPAAAQQAAAALEIVHVLERSNP